MKPTIIHNAVAPLLLSLIAAACGARADTTLGPVSVDDYGMLTIGRDVIGRVEIFNSKWAPSRQSRDTVQPNAGFPKMANGQWELSGTFRARDISTPFAINETIKADKNAATYHCRITAGEDVEVRTIALTLLLPVDKFGGQKVLFDSREVVLPSEFSGSQDVFQASGVKTILIALPNGNKLTVTGPVDLYVQDDRRFQGTAYSMRVYFNPKSGSLKKGNDSAISVGFETGAN